MSRNRLRGSGQKGAGSSGRAEQSCVASVRTSKCRSKDPAFEGQWAQLGQTPRSTPDGLNCSIIAESLIRLTLTILLVDRQTGNYVSGTCDFRLADQPPTTARLGAIPAYKQLYYSGFRFIILWSLEPGTCNATAFLDLPSHPKL